MAKLSVAIIAYNEEKNIARCLKALRNVADEIVVVDSYSADATATVAEEHGAVVHQVDFKGFATQKNIATELCTGDLILSLDADEVPDERLLAEIGAIKDNAEFDAYQIGRKTFVGDKWISSCGWYPDRLVRLWKKGSAQWQGSHVHENVVLTQGATIKMLAGHILHYSFAGIADQVSKANKYSTFSAEKKYSNGKRGALWKIAVFPLWRFFRDFVIKRGFSDGFYGFAVATCNSFETFLKYAKLLEIERQSKKH